MFNEVKGLITMPQLGTFNSVLRGVTILLPLLASLWEDA